MAWLGCRESVLYVTERQSHIHMWNWLNKVLSYDGSHRAPWIDHAVLEHMSPQAIALHIKSQAKWQTVWVDRLVIPVIHPGLWTVYLIYLLSHMSCATVLSVHISYQYGFCADYTNLTVFSMNMFRELSLYKDTLGNPVSRVIQHW